MNISSNLDKFSESIVNFADRWYSKSNLPKIMKEFLFLIIVLTGTLIGDLGTYLKKSKK